MGSRALVGSSDISMRICSILYAPQACSGAPEVPPEICHAVFPAGFGVSSQQSLIFVRCNNYIGESCDDLLGATARNSVCRSSTCSQSFARVSARLFSILPAPERGSKMAAKIGVRKAKCYFRRHSFGFHFRPLLSIPTSEPEMRKLLDKGARKFGGRNTAKLAARARSDKSSFRTFSSRFEMQLSISYCCLPAPCSYDGIKRRHHIGTHSIYIYI